MIREKVLEEIVRVTEIKATMAIVDRGLPKNKIGRFLRIIKNQRFKGEPQFLNAQIVTKVRSL